MTTRYLLRRLALLSLGLVLLGCAPTVDAPLPPDTPLYYPADYDTLFDATLQALITSYVETYGGERLTFALTQAERDTGLIKAVHQELREVSVIEPYEDRDNETWLFIPFVKPHVYRMQSTVTLVVRPEGNGGASLAYNTTDSYGSNSKLANTYMAKVINKLDARFFGALSGD